MIARILLAACLGATAVAGQSLEAVGHDESDGVTAWARPAARGGASLEVARQGQPRLECGPLPRIHDLVVDQGARGAFLLVDAGAGDAVDLVWQPFEAGAQPRALVRGLHVADRHLCRTGEDVAFLTQDAVMVADRTGRSRVLVRREDPAIRRVTVNDARTLFATQRGGEIELVSASGALLGSFGPGRAPAFVADDVLAFVRETGDGSAIMVVQVGEDEPEPRSLLALAGAIGALKAAGERGLTFRAGVGEFWLLHVDSRVVRPLDPGKWGSLRAASGTPAITPPARAARRSPGEALPEPETPESGFFWVDDFGHEVRTDYEKSEWDDVRFAGEAAIHDRLLTTFVQGLQWPFLRPAAYEPHFASDDEPLRPRSTVPHLGLDIGSRLSHAATGSVAFYAAGAATYPLYPGARTWRDAEVRLRGEGPGAHTATYAVLQEVELRDAGYLLRVHLAYTHVTASFDEPMTPDRDDVIAWLDALDDKTPSGGWESSDPALVAARISKGNHVHIGIGGVYTTYNGAPAAAARKLRWCRDALIPALRKAAAPR